MTGRGPTFLGIGAPKTGTTWLHAELRRHPEIWMPPEKELHWFDSSPSYVSPNELAEPSPLRRLVGLRPWQAPRTARNLGRLAKAGLSGDGVRVRWLARLTTARYDDDWYAGLFDAHADHPQRGEITPAYAMLRDADIARLRAMNPDMRLILIMRDPIDREWSALRYNIGRGMLAIDIERTDLVLECLGRPHDQEQFGVVLGPGEHAWMCWTIRDGPEQIIDAVLLAVRPDTTSA